jgi:hypothetical protein
MGCGDVFVTFARTLRQQWSSILQLTTSGGALVCFSDLTGHASVGGEASSLWYDGMLVLGSSPYGSSANDGADASPIGAASPWNLIRLWIGHQISEMGGELWSQN